MTEVNAVLIDTVSIQKYIFNSNRLKNNLGASLLVMDVFDRYLKTTIQALFPQLPYDDSAWKEQPESYKISAGQPFEIGYIGGGNALLFFWTPQQASDFIRAWTRLLLEKCPGLKTAVARQTIVLNNDGFDHALKGLFEQLQLNKSSYLPQTTLTGFGFTAECTYTGLPADTWLDKGEDSKYISQVASAKRQAARHLAEHPERLLGDDILPILQEQWSFPEDLEALGQKKGEDNHIAVVHIDGNSMGERFRSARQLKDLRALSHSVREATQRAFYALVEEAKLFTTKMHDLSPLDPLKILHGTGDFVLPLRPIILGGDDITFITHGKLGVYFAEKYMQAFQGQPASDQQALSSCAGVAVIKSKYPFYKGIKLAEELCQSAKSQRREQKSQGSWLDFQIANANISGALADIRKEQYTLSDGGAAFHELLLRPYPLTASSSAQQMDFEEVKAKLGELFVNGRSKWPRNKIKALRSVLYDPSFYHERFVESERLQGNTLPSFKHFDLNRGLFNGGKTPLFDLIELSELYPLSEILTQEPVHA